MYDLALSPFGDLVVAGNRDLAGISGTDLIEQRIRIRLTLRRGEWLYDEDDSLGSYLYRIPMMQPDQAQGAAQGYVLEALRDMDEITVQSVFLEMGDREIKLTVLYSVLDEEGEIESDNYNLQMTFQSSPILGG